MADSRSGQAELRQQELLAAFAGGEDDWPRPIAAFLFGKLSEEKLPAQARADGKQARARVCRSWDHIAGRHAIDGKLEGEQEARAQQRQACGTANANG
ncbi:hypothetical protein [Massilia sp. DD77]|uniref:hypothetical protein n=1 Tax=Massilia sp. DD77 TaxID=3109349 RepID=UPI002FFF20B8